MSKKRSIELVVLVVAALVIIVLTPVGDKLWKAPESNSSSVSEVIEPHLAYGIPVDSLLVFSDKVKINQFLADILLKYNVDYQKIDELSRCCRDVFDVRKIRVGYNYSVLTTNDSLHTAQYFIYESSPTDYVVFDLRDSVHVHKGKKEVQLVESVASGVIQSSLWNAMVDNQTDPNLANDLSEIYAWTIDFFGLQKGDNFKVVYEKLMVEDEYIGIGKILAASFEHADKPYYAFYFIQDSIGDYFDDAAGSMRRTFLKAPLRFKRISSGFSYNRLHPILKRRMPHTGIDYAAAYGTPVHAVGDGVVTFARYKGANGNMVKIKHNGTYTTAYLHLSKFGKGIKYGTHVKQGDVIGYVGSTGRSTGAHLDFRFYRNGKPVNPLTVESPPAEPVDSLHLEKFMEHARKLQNRLDSITLSESTSLAGNK